ncbi:MAG: TetR/AcrR family transcriptional regulator [Spirochaetes bacterium]|nr:TetR/AcrR family transcriptional regulator [Spirochaetota bacterium]
MRKPDPNKKTLLLEKAEKLFLHYGISRVTIDQITKEAGVGKGTFYLFFKNKEDILTCIGLEHFKNSIEETKKQIAKPLTPEKKLNHAIKTKPKTIYYFVTTFPHGRDLLQYMDNDYIEQQGYTGIVNQYIMMFKEVLQEGIDQGIFKIKDTDKLIHHIMVMNSAFNPPYCLINNFEELEEHIEMHVRSVLALIKN